jgi:hypothetical protein
VKKKWKVLLLLAGVIILCLGLTATAVAAGEIRVTVDGSLVNFPDQKPFINNENRTMVPIAAPMNAMQATVTWDDKTRSATINKNNRNAVFTIGSRAYTVQGQKKMMDTEAVIVNGRTAFPIKFAAEALGATVTWDGATRTVMIFSSLPPKTNVIGAVEIDRMRSYKYSDSVKAPLGIFGNQNSELANYILKECTSVLKLQANQRFISSTELIWASSSIYHIRGILQTNNNDGTYREQDMDYSLTIIGDGSSRSFDSNVEALYLGEPRLTK